MTELLAEPKTPATSLRRHADPPGLWTTVFTSSIALHVIALLMLRDPRIVAVFNTQSSQPNPIPIEIVEISPQSQIQPAKRIQNRSAATINSSPVQSPPTASDQQISVQQPLPQRPRRRTQKPIVRSLKRANSTAAPAKTIASNRPAPPAPQRPIRPPRQTSPASQPQQSARKPTPAPPQQETAPNTQNSGQPQPPTSRGGSPTPQPTTTPPNSPQPSPAPNPAPPPATSNETLPEPTRAPADGTQTTRAQTEDDERSPTPQPAGEQGGTGVVPTLGEVRSGNGGTDEPEKIAQPKTPPDSSNITYTPQVSPSFGQVVVLRVLISNTGNPENVVKVVQSSGNPEYDELAKQLIKNWEFEPAYFSGQPVDSLLDVSVSLDRL